MMSHDTAVCALKANCYEVLRVRSLDIPHSALLVLDLVLWAVTHIQRQALQRAIPSQPALDALGVGQGVGVPCSTDSRAGFL